MYGLLDTAMDHCSGRSDYTVKIERELLTLLCLSLSRNPDADTAASYAEKEWQTSLLAGILGIEED